jgi:pyruvate kinase
MTNITNAISYATCTTAADLKAPCIVTITKSGFTARMVSKFKPSCPVVAVCSNPVVLRQLNLVWGCVPLPQTEDTSDIFDIAVKKAENAELATTGDPIVIVAGVPVGVSGTTNIMKVQIVGDVLVKGRGIGKKTVSGRSCVIKVAEEANRSFKPGDILVTTETNNRLLPFMKKAQAIVVGSDQKVDLTHAETVARALDLPIIICNDRVIDLIPNGTAITIDGAKGFVYNGIKE